MNDSVLTPRGETPQNVFFNNLIQRTFAERCDIEYEDIESSTVSSHFRDQEWFPAVLFPQVFSDENGSEGRQRIVRHMGNGQLVQVWEDDLVPFDWLPEYSFADVTAMTEKKPVEMRRKFKLAWRFATDYAQNREEFFLH